MIETNRDYLHSLIRVLSSEETLDHWLIIERPSKTTMIRLCECNEHLIHLDEKLVLTLRAAVVCCLSSAGPLKMFL